MDRRRKDSLTGIPTADYFAALAQAARQELADQGQPLSVLFFDMNGMKLFNSLFGYEEGDRLLQAVAQMLCRRFGAERVCRVGQDHFAAFCGDADIDTLLPHLYQEAAALNGGRTLPVHVGIYRDVPENVAPLAAVDRAKMACDMLAATYASGSRCFDTSLLAAADHRNYILEHLDQALSEGWIQAYFQPIIRSANGCICDEEALTRWIDPDKGLLSPAEFIPALEETGLIYKLDLYMVDQALAAMKKKAECGVHIVPVSVNISRADFAACDVVEEIERRVAAAGVRRDLLNVEITESAVTENPQYMRTQIDRLRAMGYKVWMDDFGSGYSSLDLLQTFDFDLIKFDMTFLRQFHTGPKSRIILAQLMKMALKLGVDTVVEGVETEEHVRFLRGIGCDKLQGMYFRRPIPLSEVIQRSRDQDDLRFENPLEADYYCAVGTANLSDPAFVDSKPTEAIRPFLHSVPMAILELQDGRISLLRCNNAYGELLELRGGTALPELDICDVTLPRQPDAALIAAAEQCRAEERWITVRHSAQHAHNINLHSMLRRLAVNPVTGAVAVIVVVIAGL